MKRIILTGAALAILGGLAQAQGPASAAHDMRRDQGVAEVSPTPEMWFYQQERARYEDSQGSVRRKAEMRASNRSSRIAAMKWYGMSNSRPVVSTTPVMGTYSPTWTSNTPDPFRWRASSPSTVVLRPGTGAY